MEPSFNQHSGVILWFFCLVLVRVRRVKRGHVFLSGGGEKYCCCAEEEERRWWEKMGCDDGELRHNMES